jgi:hypothetical protein
MDGRDRGAIERGIELAPFPHRDNRTGGKPHRLQHAAIIIGSAGNISPRSVTDGRSSTPVRGAWTGPLSASSWA